VKKLLLLPVLLAAGLSSAFLRVPQNRAYPVYLPQVAFLGYDLSAISTAAPPIPLAAPTAAPTAVPTAAPTQAPVVPPELVARWVNGQAGLLVGVYVEGKLALPVVQQPAGQSGYVSERDEVLTQFAPASDYGVTGLLAHNFLSGAQFFALAAGDPVALVYGDGSIRRFQIIHALRYQALQPTNTYSDFIDLADPDGRRISSTEVFRRVYMEAGRIVFQTCIEANGNPSWGRLFVIGEEIR